MKFEERRAELMFLLLLFVISFGLRVYKIEVPNRLIGDEVYYVPAARSILGQNDAGVPQDPRLAHPPLGKMMIALGMFLFGDNPFGWRILSAVAGSLLIPVSYLVAKRLASGRKELNNMAYLASFVMAFETLGFYFSRVARLDIFMMLFFLAGVFFLLDVKPKRRLVAAPFFAASFLAKEAAAIMILPVLLYSALRMDEIKGGKAVKRIKLHFDIKQFALLAILSGLAVLVLWYILEWVILTPTRANIVDRILVMIRRLDIDNPAAVGRSQIWMWFFNQPVTRAAAVIPGVRIDFTTVVVGPLLNPNLQYAYIIQPSWTLILPMVPGMIYMMLNFVKEPVARFSFLYWFGVLTGWIVINVVFRGLVYLFYVLTFVPAVVFAISYFLSRRLYEESRTKSVKWFGITLLFVIAHLANFVALYPVPIP
ncbi:MAG: glycosyltransferase family 39 protein [Candidatus Caldarchaeum sp.]|nr:glycosyltransferase family 39 protein [Candidatus Caldarchaeum sp.]MDW8434724.1 glycosyltransferase family 39 protein [Candidatus Caldarchaeum sp.]